MQLHHIIPEANCGPDTLDNCIPLCLDCHEDVGSYNEKHPIGKKFSEDELKKHRDRWFEFVAAHPERVNHSSGAHLRDSDVHVASGDVPIASISPVDPQKLSRHDLQLLERFDKLFPIDSSTMRFLREHDLANSFENKLLYPLYDFAGKWITAEHEFDDPDLEKARNRFHKSTVQFTKLLSINTWPSKRHPGFQTMGFNDMEMDSEKWKMRDRLNKLGTQVYKSHQSFVRIRREKMRSS